MKIKSKSSVSTTLFAAITGLAMLNGCAVDPELSDQVSEIKKATGSFVTDWSAIAADAIVRPVEASPTLRAPGHSSMLMAQVQNAIYDVMVTLRQGHFEAFSYDGQGHGNEDVAAAVATAAYRVLYTRVPGRAAYLDGKYAAALAAIPDGKQKTNGIALGEEVAAHYLALRANDNLDNTYTWVQPTTGPGVFEPVVAAQPVDYKMVFAQPWTFDIGDSASFFPPPPPALTSDEYTTTWTEVRDLGRVDGTIRTAAQKEQALWTGENGFRWASRNQINLAVATGLEPMDAARFLALAFTSNADAFQTGMSAKYHYNFWRPFHSIPRADTDGNPATAGDPTWKPTLNVNHPEYPAGHGFFGGGSMVEAVRVFFGTDNVAWTVDAVGVPGLTTTARPYTSLDALSDDIMDGRILAGLHYRFSMDAGKDQGIAVVHHVAANHYQPTNDD